MSLTLAVLCTLCPQGPNGTEAVPAERILTMVPVHGLFSRRLGTHVQLPIGNLLAGQRTGWLLGDPEAAAIEPDALQALLSALTRYEDLESLAVTSNESMLRIVGQPEPVRRIEASARALVAQLQARITIRAELHLLPQPTPLAAIAADAEIARLLRPETRVWAAAGSVRNGEVCALLDEQRTRFVGDHEVEVAQEARIGDPIVSSLFEGVGIAVEPHRLAGSADLVLFCQFALGDQVRPAPSRNLGIPDAPSLDAPELEALSGTMSGRLPPGTALVLQSERRNGSVQVLVVRAAREAGAEPQALPGVLPVSALLTSAFARMPVADELETQTTMEHLQERAGLREPTPWLGFDSIDELVGTLEETLLLSERECSVTVQAGHLVLGGPAAPAEEVGRMLRHWQDQWLRTVELACETGTSPDPATDPGERRRLSFPCLLGRNHFVAAGTQTLGVVDYDVEIAQKSAMPNPVTALLYDGLVARCLIRPDLEGIGAQVELTVADHGELMRRSTEMKAGGHLFLAPEHRARLRFDGPILSGRRIDLGQTKTSAHAVTLTSR